MKNIIENGLSELGLADKVPADAAERLARYGELLLEKNQVMNLTAIKEPEQVARLHMLDCAALLRCVELPAGAKLVDVGTGAGFPGMVLKLVRPELDVTLLDSLNKRLDWLDEVADGFGLTGIRTVHKRAEEGGLDPDFREQFDFASSRAVADLRLLCELCLPYVRVGGAMLAMKAVDCDAELSGAANCIKLLGGKVEKLVDYPVPGAELSHRLVLIRKVEHTPKGYPRRWAKIQKAPL